MVINILIPYCTVRLCCISAQSSDTSIIPYGTMASLHLALNMLFSTRHLVMFLMDSVCNDLEWCHSLHLWQNEAMVCVFAFLLQKKYISFWLCPINATHFFVRICLELLCHSIISLSLLFFIFLVQKDLWWLFSALDSKSPWIEIMLDVPSKRSLHLVLTVKRKGFMEEALRVVTAPWDTTHTSK